MILVIFLQFCSFTLCRILSVPIMQRHVAISLDGMPGLALFGHPSLLYLASAMSGEALYATVDRVVPVLAPYTVVLTDAKVCE